MIVKAWRAATYGIRVGKPNARNYFRQHWDHIEVEIDGEFYSFKLSPTFWTTCPEIRGGPIPSWLGSQGLIPLPIIPWPERNPPEFELIPLGDNKFRLLRTRSGGIEP
jgi:hypothetical protein